MRVIYLSLVAASMMVSPISFANDTSGDGGTSPEHKVSTTTGETDVKKPDGSGTWGAADPIAQSIVHCVPDPNGENKGPERAGDQGTCPYGYVAQTVPAPGGGRMGSVPVAAIGATSLDFNHPNGRSPASSGGQSIIIERTDTK
ncbi:MAG: hypothetical protein ACXWQO_04750 [Bdellovibrionota bacterium]